MSGHTFYQIIFTQMLDAWTDALHDAQEELGRPPRIRQYAPISIWT